MQFSTKQRSGRMQYARSFHAESSVNPLPRPSACCVERLCASQPSPFALLFAHLRHQAQINLPNAANLIHILPYADRHSGQQRRAKRRRFDNGGPDNFTAQHIRLKLHQKLIGARAAIHAQFGRFLPAVRSLRRPNQPIDRQSIPARRE